MPCPLHCKIREEPIHQKKRNLTKISFRAFHTSYVRCVRFSHKLKSTGPFILAACGAYVRRVTFWGMKLVWKKHNDAPHASGPKGPLCSGLALKGIPVYFRACPEASILASQLTFLKCQSLSSGNFNPLGWRGNVIFNSNAMQELILLFIISSWNLTKEGTLNSWTMAMLRTLKFSSDVWYQGNICNGKNRTLAIKGSSQVIRDTIYNPFIVCVRSRGNAWVV